MKAEKKYEKILNPNFTANVQNIMILRLEYNKFMYVTYMLDLLGIHQVCYDRTFDGYFQKN